MTADRPLVSVVIPNRDQGRFLATAIESALGDPYGRVEVLVVDDGSCDDSAAVVRRYGDRVRPLATEGGRGACRARNLGLTAATGRYVKFLDADDYLLPGALDPQVAWLEERRRPDVSVFGRARWVDHEGRVLGQPAPPDASATEAERMILHAPLTSAPLHPVEAVRMVGGFDERVPRGQEYDLHLRMWLAGVTFHPLPLDVYAYRQHELARVSSRDGDPAVARGRLDALLRIVTLAKERHGDPLPADMRTAFARQFWKLGRRSMQQGASTVAAPCFTEAARLDPAVREGSAGYRLACAALGPVAAERIVGCVRAVRGRLAGLAPHTA
jgi:glycosyltransferase involved in cell wall biosynthesis